MRVDAEVLKRKLFYEHCLLFYETVDVTAFHEAGKLHMDYGKSLKGEAVHEIIDSLSKYSIGCLLQDVISPYVISRELISALLRSNLDLQIRHLVSKMPVNKYTVIELPYEHREDLDGYYHRSTVVCLTDQVAKGKLMLMLFSPQYHQSNHRLAGMYENDDLLACSGTLIPLEDDWDMTIQDLLERDDFVNRSDTNLLSLTDERKRYYDKIVRSLLYIHSGGNPDMREIKSNPIVTRKAKKLGRQFSERNLFPYTAVGMGFNKTPLYVKDRWEYYRWQPYGPRDNPDYKFIPIVAHRRKPLAIKGADKEVKENAADGHTQMS